MKRRFFTILGVALALFVLFVGCKKEDYRADSARAGTAEASEAATQTGYHGASSSSSGAGVDGILDEYIANLRAFSYYSGALTLEPATGSQIGAGLMHPVTYSLQYDYAVAPNGARQYDFSRWMCGRGQNFTSRCWRMRENFWRSVWRWSPVRRLR